jgi:hypothetical protein
MKGKSSGNIKEVFIMGSRVDCKVLREVLILSIPLSKSDEFLVNISEAIVQIGGNI